MKSWFGWLVFVFFIVSIMKKMINSMYFVYYYHRNTDLLFPYVYTNSKPDDGEGQLFLLPSLSSVLVGVELRGVKSLVALSY